MSHRRAKQGPTASSAVMFGEELRFYREMLGYTQEELGKLLHCNRTNITRYESGKRRMPADSVEDADRVLKTGGLLKRLWDRVDWEAEVEHPDWFRDHADMEAEAVAVRVFQYGVVLGLLQCPEYARAVFEASDAAGNPELIAERTAARLGRQKRFLDPDGPLLLAVLDESAIRTVYGGPGVMRRQMQHLLAAAQLPNILIQVAPFASRRTIIDASMVLLEMPDGQNWVYSESLDRGHPSDVAAIVARHRRSYDRLRGDVLSVDASLALIADALEGFRDDEERDRRVCLAQEQLQRRQRGQLHRNGPRIPRRRSGA
ncbi:helix-turn-helix transcriptional regulator [Kitasatospora sp. CM 4170]|uniref:Helix-turn-helix transcriptional regulator n=1 Tax=Kitasatospora aburaviensis TaxID=67265 RepID=A0ABW1EVY4_9ACTN|nr:helix-turn-helix transcriptional regulator [Kitasatospora sp. CM 4170]WNM48046.1 helix-turn-helix transcriptional regulator [Kitasatospora sp. CM 4170]